MRSLLSPSPHLSNVRVHSHVYLFRMKFWVSKAMYRGSVADFWALQGFEIRVYVPVREQNENLAAKQNQESKGIAP